ncbi:MAG: hypothetical protein JO336_03650 [Acidobacteriia bacterium]|nr:hypothetical protein [Terriglobia bacterium]MBV8906554.1 hypothetical protein [Terriglobia bacterium]
MSLVTPKTPPEIIRAFTAGLGDFLSPNDPLWSVMLEKFFALEQFNLDLDEFNPAGPLDSMVDESGWRFLAADGDLYGGVHVGSVIEGLPPKVTGFSRDTEVLTAAESFDDLNTIPQVQQRAYEPRVLRVAWLRFEAFWLKPTPDTYTSPGVRDESQDLVIPYIGFVERPPKTFGPTKLELMTPYWVADFLNAVNSRKPTPPPPPPKSAHVLPRGGFDPKTTP